MLSSMEAKYGGKSTGEPTQEEFDAAAKRLKVQKAAKGAVKTSKKQGKKAS